MRTRSNLKRKLKSPKKTRQKEKCKVCKQDKVLLLHLAKAKKCREQYLDFEEMKKEKTKQYQKAYHKEYREVDAENQKERWKLYYKANSARIKINQRQYVLDNRQAYLERKMIHNHGRQLFNR